MADDLVARNVAKKARYKTPPKPKAKAAAKKSAFNDPAFQAKLDAILAGGGPPVGKKSSAPNLSAERGNGSLGLIGVGNPNNGRALSLDAAAKQAQIARVNADIVSNGGTVEKTRGSNSIFHRTMDVLSRGNYASANAFLENRKEFKKKGDISDALAAGWKGFLQGGSGKKKTTFSDVLRNEGVTGKKAAALGLGLDIAADPTTYLGLGLVGKVGKGADISKAIQKAGNELPVGVQLSRQEKRILTGANLTNSTINKRMKGGKAVNETVIPVAQLAANAAAKLKSDKILNDLAGSPNLSIGEVKQAAKVAGDKEFQSTLATILKNHADVAKTPIERRIALSIAGTKVGIPVAGDIPVKVMVGTKNLARSSDPVMKSVETFNKALRVSAGVLPNIHQIKLDQFGQGAIRARLRGVTIASHLGHLKGPDREIVLRDAIHGTDSGRLLKDGTPAAAWVGNHLREIQGSIKGDLDPDMRLSPAELNAWASGGLKFNQGTIEVLQKIKVKGKTVPKYVKQPDPDWVINSIKQYMESGNKDGKDAGRALWALESAVEKTRALKAMNNAVVKSFGVPLGPDTVTSSKALVSKGWREPKIEAFKGHIFDPEAAQSIEKIYELLTDSRKSTAFSRNMSRINAPIKSALTIYSPSFHTRNLMGDAFINHIDGVSLKAYRAAAKVLNDRVGKFETQGPQGSGQFAAMLKEGDPLVNAAQSPSPKTRQALIKNVNKLKRADGSVPAFFSEDEIYAGFNKYGMGQNYSSADITNTLEDVPVGLASAKTPFKGKVKEKILAGSDIRENYMRMAHFIHMINKADRKSTRTLDDAMTAAAERVRQTHFDYSDITRFERQVMSNLAPFYKWTRKSLPLMAETLFTHPGKVTTIPKMNRAMSELAGYETDDDELFPSLDEVVPKWMRDAGFVPVGEGISDASIYAKIPSPFDDSFGGAPVLSGINTDAGVGNVISSVMGQVTPVIKSPMELLAGKKFFGDVPIYDKEGKLPSTFGPVPDYALQHFPQGNVALQSKKGNVGSIISHLSGIGTQENNEARQIGELYRQEDVATAKKKKLYDEFMKKYGVKHPDDTRKEKK